MLKILKLIVIFILSIGIFINLWIWTTNWTTNWIGAFDDEAKKPIYLCDSWDCGLEKWADLVRDSGIEGIVIDWTASDQIQKIIVYLLRFITLIAVIYIIYAWFRILTSSWEDEVIKSQKKTIIYVIVWIVVIWFAWTIANFAVTIGTGWV